MVGRSKKKRITILIKRKNLYLFCLIYYNVIDLIGEISSFKNKSLVIHKRKKWASIKEAITGISITM